MYNAPMTDPHRAWLKELRALNVRVASGLSDDQPGTVPGLQEQMTKLRDEIIDTEPTTRDGIFVLVALLGDLTWSDPTRRLAANLHRSLENVWPV